MPFPEAHHRSTKSTNHLPKPSKSLSGPTLKQYLNAATRVSHGQANFYARVCFLNQTASTDLQV
eukprot:7314928-Ditylum_brightwellii.AAC.1